MIQIRNNRTSRAKLNVVANIFSGFGKRFVERERIQVGVVSKNTHIWQCEQEFVGLLVWHIFREKFVQIGEFFAEQHFFQIDAFIMINIFDYKDLVSLGDLDHSAIQQRPKIGVDAGR
jgi:hypothetical protein